MSDKSTSADGPVPFGQHLTGSQGFMALFREGMALVEETACYLDGAGRRDSKNLERSSALAYATESMRLTTRLMQMASWLLLHRAVHEGEMSLPQANQEKRKVRLSAGDTLDNEAVQLLPIELRELIERSLHLQDRVRRLDATIHAGEARPGSNPVERQLGMLRAAFERGAR